MWDPVHDTTLKQLFEFLSYRSHPGVPKHLQPFVRGHLGSDKHVEFIVGVERVGQHGEKRVRIRSVMSYGSLGSGMFMGREAPALGGILERLVYGDGCLNSRDLLGCVGMSASHSCIFLLVFHSCAFS